MKGEIVLLYAFDIAHEIATDRIREILSKKPFPFEIRMGKTIPKDLPIYRPLTIALAPEEYDTSVGRITLKPFVKIIDIGVVSISLEIPFDRPALSDLTAYHHIALKDNRTLDQLAETICSQVRESIKPALIKPNEKIDPPEAYTIFCVSGVEDGPIPAWVGARKREIAALLMEETNASALSDMQINEVLDHTLHYTNDDAVVIDWDAALIIDRDEYYDDVLYVIELANLQLEEFQYIDRLLETLRERSYGDVERYYRAARFLGLPTRTLTTLRHTQMDLAKMSDEVTNIAKFSGDWYLARVYLACRDRFHIDRWRESVREKLASLEHLYNVVNGEIANRRMVLLEGIIVVLFILDVLMLLILKKG